MHFFVQGHDKVLCHHDITASTEVKYALLCSNIYENAWHNPPHKTRQKNFRLLRNFPSVTTIIFILRKSIDICFKKQLYQSIAHVFLYIFYVDHYFIACLLSEQKRSFYEPHKSMSIFSVCYDGCYFAHCRASSEPAELKFSPEIELVVGHYRKKFQLYRLCFY